MNPKLPCCCTLASLCSLLLAGCQSSIPSRSSESLAETGYYAFESEVEQAAWLAEESVCVLPDGASGVRNETPQVRVVSINGRAYEASRLWLVESPPGMIPLAPGPSLIELEVSFRYRPGLVRGKRLFTCRAEVPFNSEAGESYRLVAFFRERPEGFYAGVVGDTSSSEELRFEDPRVRSQLVVGQTRGGPSAMVQDSPVAYGERREDDPFYQDTSPGNKPSPLSEKDPDR